MFTQEFRIDHPGYKVTAIDTTGAGDAFFGVVLYYINLRKNNPDKQDWYKIIDKACYIAAETTKYHGAMDSYVKAIENIEL